MAKGARVRRLRIGDRAYGFEMGNPKGGFYAEYVVVNERNAARKPARLDFDQAAAGAATGLTAQQGIDGALRVRRGETVLIFAASGAVGTLAVPFARRRGARVIATATGRKATNVVRRLGVEAVIDARDPKAIERLRALTPDGIDAALALAGGDELERCLDFMRDAGRIAYPNGVEPEPQQRRKFRISLYDDEAGPREFARLARAVAQARLRVPIEAKFALGQAAAAHRHQRQHVVGRIVLQIRGR